MTLSRSCAPKNAELHCSDAAQRYRYAEEVFKTRLNIKNGIEKIIYDSTKDVSVLSRPELNRIPFLKREKQIDIKKMRRYNILYVITLAQFY